MFVPFGEMTNAVQEVIEGERTRNGRVVGMWAQADLYGIHRQLTW